MTELRPESVPRLPRGVRLRHDETRGQWTLLAPERVLQLDVIAAEVLKRCTGDVSFAQIVDDLATTFATDRARIESDVGAMLAGLVDKKVLLL